MLVGVGNARARLSALADSEFHSFVNSLSPTKSLNLADRWFIVFLRTLADHFYNSRQHLRVSEYSV